MLVAICSVKGSPGVTTFSLALAARWPNPHASCVVVEADPAGGDVAARFDQPTTPGLLSLAAASRRDNDPRLVWQHTQALPGGLPVVLAPVGAEQTRAALTALNDADSLHRAGQADKAVVVVDCGRLDPAPAAAFLHAADHALVMVRARAADLAHLASRLAAISRRARQVHVLLVGPGHTTGEVARELGVPVLGTVPDDRRGAAALTGSPTPRSFRPARHRLSRSAARIAGTLALAADPPIPDRADETITIPAVGLDAGAVPNPDGSGQRGGRP